MISSEEQIHSTLKCDHCNEEVFTPFEDLAGHTFCCQGCKSVYAILNENNLGKFYSIQRETGEFTKPVQDLQSSSYNYLDEERFLLKYGKLIEAENSWSMSFYLKGVHCIACLWLIENLGEIVPDVQSARLDMGKSLVTVSLKPGLKSFSRVAQGLNKIGYPPFPISNQDELQHQKQKEERSLFLKLGVAGFSMMNIMLYSGSVYAGAKGWYLLSFGYLSFILALPVVLYSALPFYTSALGAIRSKRINIDVPLSFAILSGFLISSYFVFQGSEHVYFDSISTLTFLILLSRIILKKAQQNSLNKNDLLSIFQRGNYFKLIGQERKEILPEDIQLNDTVLIPPHQNLPCDGVLLSDETRINMSSLTGESRAILHKKGNNVFMGTSNLGEEIQVKVTAIGRETRMGRILEKLEQQGKNESAFSYLTDTISKYFVSAVFLLAVVTFIVTSFYSSPLTALENALALIIVTCPCALGLATPLTFSRIMERARSRGIVLKNEETIEKLSKVENIFFDKTGTLTSGSYEVVSYQVAPKVVERFSELINILYSLETKSQHPIAKSIIRWCSKINSPLKNVVFDIYEEILGKGVKGFFNNMTYEVFTINNSDGYNEVVLVENGTQILSLLMKDQIKPESERTLNNLRMENFKTFMVSGDKDEIVREVSNKLSFKNSESFSEKTPEQKAEIIAEYSNSLFVGDGANDSLAFDKATVSLATHGSVEMSLRVSNIFLSKDDLSLIPEALSLSKLGVKVIKRNLSFSLFYNITGAALAIAGIIGPLEAAILMPVSSLTVLANTLISTRERRTHGGS